MTENEISKIIVDSAIEVHKTLGGPGLLESVYHESLYFELQSRGLLVEKELQVPITYKGNKLAAPLRLDLLVERKVIIEAKSVVNYNNIFETQVLTYLRLLNLKLGLVINFGEKRVSSGIHRVVNNL
ncbi:MAG TPA: GxxExxY protein [Pyrinomonadaceae bacterium]|nr:GxxExxY protein [Pyrinomonadaceae bacterium]